MTKDCGVDITKRGGLKR